MTFLFCSKFDSNFFFDKKFPKKRREMFPGVSFQDNARIIREVKESHDIYDFDSKEKSKSWLFGNNGLASALNLFSIDRSSNSSASTPLQLESRSQRNCQTVEYALSRDNMPIDQMIRIIKQAIKDPILALETWGQICYDIWIKCGAFEELNETNKRAFRTRSWLKKAFQEFRAYTPWPDEGMLHLQKKSRNNTFEHMSGYVEQQARELADVSELRNRALRKKMSKQTIAKHENAMAKLRKQIAIEQEKRTRFNQVAKIADLVEPEDFPKPFATKNCLHKLNEFISAIDFSKALSEPNN